MRRIIFEAGKKNEQRGWRGALARFLSAEAIDHVAREQAGRSPQFLIEREATALFLDWEGFQAELARIPAVLAIDGAARASKIVADAVFGEGGAIVSSNGLGVMAVFGVPVAAAGAEARAQRAAAAVIGKLEALAVEALGAGERPRRKMVGVGLASGWIRSGIVGSGERVELFASGVPLRNAERLARDAAAGEIGTLR